MSGDGTLTLDHPGRRIAVRSPDGTRLNVESYGPAEAPTVILAHGWTCSVVFWTKQVDALVADGLRVVVYDQRGHGASGVPGPAGHSLDALADDLSAVLQAVLAPGRKAVLAGHSMGAMTMIAFGGRHPRELRERVAGAMLASTAMNELVVRNRIVPLPLPLAKLARPVISTLMGMSPAGNRTNRWQRFITRYSGLSRSASEADVMFCTTLIGSCPPHTRAAFARTLSRLDLDAQVPGFTVPTIVVGGTRDRLTPIWHARRLAAALPELLEFVEIPGSGHMTPVQSADQVNAVLLRLVREHLVPASNPAEEMHAGPASGSIDDSAIPGSTTTAQETA
jgi:pimeloyl-ACP methyl ester carboxylesterase